MYIELDQTHMGGHSFEKHLKEVVQEQTDTILAGMADKADASGMVGDITHFSDEAIAAFKEAALEPIKNGTFSLESIERRIGVVREEIARVWNSPLPDKEKWREISSKENEIALLQAGQFTFAKAGFSLKV